MHSIATLKANMITLSVHIEIFERGEALETVQSVLIIFILYNKMHTLNLSYLQVKEPLGLNNKAILCFCYF